MRIVHQVSVVCKGPAVNFVFLSFVVIAYAHVHIGHIWLLYNMPHTRKSAAKRQISPHLVRICCVALD